MKNKYNNLDAFLSYSDYWDYTLTNDYNDDECCSTNHIASFNFNEDGVISGNSIISSVIWDGCINNGVTLNDVGLVGLDNGLITFSKESYSDCNLELKNRLTGSSLVIESDDCYFKMNKVSGYTKEIVYGETGLTYPIETIYCDEVGYFNRFCGGFYQGFYKLEGYDYQVLPNRPNDEISYEFVLRPNNIYTIENPKSDFYLNCESSSGESVNCESVCDITGVTLNDIYPENEGIFFYIGTRAENKFWNVFSGNNPTIDVDCTSGLTYMYTPEKETDISTSNGIHLNSSEVFEWCEDNKFITFNRTENGYTTCNYEDCMNMTSFTDPSSYIITENKYITYNRTPTGKTTCDEDKNLISSGETLYDPYLDVVDNNLAFSIKDDGSICYKKVILSGQCSGDTNQIYVSSITAVEECSPSGLVRCDEWNHVVMRLKFPYLDDCELETEGPRVGKLMVYVNGLLKHVFDDFTEVIPRGLNTNKEKQQTVAYNISLGGGSQGLLENVTFDGMDYDDLGLLIEKNFGGSFIGDIMEFNIINGVYNWCEIKNNTKKYPSVNC